ncbi:MAG: hypothetical protein JST89_16505 [Cyanobacteria bacterium SZAS-4]|nr:hypothetical protein [Cyanobacteria bacterium SZAS-4]
MLSVSQRIPLHRLRQMREALAENLEKFEKMPRLHDNSLRGAIQGMACLRRIKHAGLVGKFYWRKDRLQAENTGATNADWSSGMLNYDAQKEQPYLQLMRQDPDLCGGLDFAQIGMAMGMELNCFSTFLAGSVKDETTDGYQLKQAFMEISAPPTATSITLTSIKTIAQTMIAMPVMVTQPDRATARTTAEKPAPKRRSSRSKAKDVASKAVAFDNTDVFSDTKPAKKRTKKSKAADKQAVVLNEPTNIKSAKTKKEARSKKRLDSAS